ncbi:DNRLRE domain-containing protein [Streptomyces sp. NPDC047928]|uniref:DNRLRE domain-containing protein n=1 Tax=unclassified Streptomyces TaxID=2593676 RepID=UPI003717C384
MKRPRKRRRIAVLAALLAVAIAVPAGVHLVREDAATPAPRAEAKSAPERTVDAGEAIRQAKRTGKDVVVTDRHTPHSTTWAQPDGLLRTRTHSDTIRARVGDGWKPVDTTLRRVENGWRPKATNVPVVFSAGNADAAISDDGGARASRAVLRAPLAPADAPAWTELVRLSSGGHELVVSWPGPLPAPVVDGPRALYENVRPGIDLLLTARDGGYSHVLVVHSRQAADDPLLDRLQYRLASPTLDFALDATTHVVSARNAAGQEVASAPTPYLWDSAGTVKATLGEPAPTPDPALKGTALALPGLAGPQPGSHDAALGATFDDSTGTLGLAVNAKKLADPDVVYPVFIDPSFTGRKLNWTLLYQKYPSSSFYNGQNFNDGTNDARVGYESTTGGLSRSVFTFEFGSQLHSANIKSASFRALQTYSWGCSARQYNLYLTGTISSSSTWNNQPSWTRVLSSQTNGHGYRSDTCPDKWIAMDIRSAAQEAATGKWSKLTLGLRAANESDAAAWKKFLANGESSPSIEVIHNVPPNEPVASAMKMTPGTTCDAVSPFPVVGKTDLIFSVTGSDKDNNLAYVNLYIWPTGDTANPVVNRNYAPNSSGTINPGFTWDKFTHGKTYSWTARTIDTDGYPSAWGPTGTTAHCQFTVDHTVPTPPEVTSTAFPEPGPDGDVWSPGRFGVTGTFTFTGVPADAVKEFQYSFNTAYDRKITATNNKATTPAIKPPHAGPSVLYVRSVDAAGNISSATKYVFYVSPPPILDYPGDVTGDNVADVYTVNPKGNLELYAKTQGTDRFHASMEETAYEATDGGKVTKLEDGYWTGALITHNGDWLPGDGIQDLVARMGDGKLYVYPGDGYGGFNVKERRHILLPAGAPAASGLRQILSVGDVTGDGRPDMVAVSGGTLWAFTGYSGVSFTKATQLTGEDWTQRDVVQVAHLAGDGTADLVYRDATNGQLYLRYGKPATGGGLDFASLATKAASGGQLDTYGNAGFTRTALPILTGTPDVTGDGIPEVWGLWSNGDVRVWPGGPIGLNGSTAFYVVKDTVKTTWLGHTAIG